MDKTKYMSDTKRYAPVGLNKADDNGISIDWADGGKSCLPMNFLRASCPCATCVDEWSGEVKVKPEDVMQVRVKKIAQVGSYAFSIGFSDGHDTGIFTYERLRHWGDEFDKARADEASMKTGPVGDGEEAPKTEQDEER